MRRIVCGCWKKVSGSKVPPALPAPYACSILTGSWFLRVWSSFPERELTLVWNRFLLAHQTLASSRFAPVCRKVLAVVSLRFSSETMSLPLRTSLISRVERGDWVNTHPGNARARIMLSSWMRTLEDAYARRRPRACMESYSVRRCWIS